MEDFISRFPAPESHYCRSSTYHNDLDSSLNGSVMHRVKLEKCGDSGIVKINLDRFRNICNEFNIGFCRSKKKINALCV